MTTSGLADRIRAALVHDATTREVSMFGGLSFMVNDRLLVAVHGDGDLLVRVDPARSRELIERPGARPAEMGTGRAMGPGWISVARDAVATDQQLSFWVDAAMDHNADAAARER